MAREQLLEKQVDAEYLSFIDPPPINRLKEIDHHGLQSSNRIAHIKHYYYIVTYTLAAIANIIILHNAIRPFINHLPQLHFIS